MKIFYENTDISDYVQVRACTGKDGAGERCDGLELEMENAERWFRWGPKEDDRIRVIQNGYDTGILYVHSILPEDGRFRLCATSLPCRARKKEYRSYINKSLLEILGNCAAVSGMDYQIFGLDGDMRYPYLQQEKESCAAFLHRLMQMEGAELKCVNGKYTGIGVLYAQQRSAHQTVRLSAEQSGAAYRRTGEKYRALTVRSPWAEASAEDEGAEEGKPRIVCTEVPARNDAQAGRWARGLLLQHNRQCEQLTLASEFNRGFTALTRVNVTGGTDADGEWLIQDVEHDFINLTSTARMHRCIPSIV